MKIIGHQKIIDYLVKSVHRKKLAQSYLFCGPAQVGKKMVAKYFAATILCEQEENPCLQCDSCLRVAQDEHPDIYYVQPEENKEIIGINQIRSMKNAAIFSPFSGSAKIVIIEKADNLSKAAANSLLKILEDPPDRVFIILLAQGLANLPSTIYSRCQVLRLKPPHSSEIISFLQEEFNFDQEKAEKITSLSWGLPGRAINLVKNKELGLKKQEELISKFLFFLTERDNLENKIKLSDLILKSESQESLFVLLQVVRDFYLIKAGLNSATALKEEQKKKLAQMYSFLELRLFAQEIMRVRNQLTAPLNKKLLIENLFFNNFT
ncbi:DNA polymerase III subunit delta' [Patescibacteria group bacterium]|nr:DNA polymerase III subunit delta' [Patescibacteria group bacterium]